MHFVVKKELVPAKANTSPTIQPDFDLLKYKTRFNKH